MAGKRSTSTVVSCMSPVVVGQGTTCSATVTDTSPVQSSTPTGIVNFVSSGAVGTFSSNACTLASGTCSVTFTPSASGDTTVNGNYAGDAAHGTSTGSSTVTVNLRATGLAVYCDPVSVVAGTVTTCRVAVTDESAGTATGTLASTPTGAVALTSSGDGAFSEASCNLTGAGPSSFCSVTYTPSGTMLRTDTITASYSGDSSHGTSTNTAQVNVTIPSNPFDYTLSVNPNTASIVVGGSTSFTITATLTGGTGQPVNLIGSISPQLMVCQPVYDVSPCGTVTLSSPSVTPTSAGATSTVTISTTNIVPPGTYTLTITGSPSGVSLHSAVFTLTVRGAGPVSTSVGVVCPPGSAMICSSSSCAATVTGSSPTGLVTFSAVGSNGGMVVLTASSCTLYSGSCSVSLRGLSAGTVTVTAVYSGDTNNLGSSGSASFAVQKPANAVASNSASSTLFGGKVSTDQTSVTGVSVSITGSTTADGTSVTMVTQHLSSLSTGVGPISLNNAAYYDVLVSGVSNGNAAVCITDQSAGSATTMMYWDGKGWVNASGVSVVVGSQVCGTIPVSALTGTNVVVGDMPPTPLSPTLLVIIGLIVVAAVATAVLVLSRRKKTTRNPLQ
ncbi:hypothetical protein E6H23_08190 [Candidatus Bathyarchaeota archaeon]|nr:MAG: hypothetical protein E6H23_08190 [Candidatus Bathyarchaeota archaeon]